MMQNFKFSLLFLLLILLLSISCKSHYQYENSKYASGKLSSQEMSNLNNFLVTKSSQVVRDTIIINYNYNNANCWQMLDQQSDEYIRDFLDGSKEYVRKNTANRSKMNYFQFREPGNNVNKKILWDDSISLDDTLFLKNLLFLNKQSCGNSAIILPNGDFIIVKNDSHKEALSFDKKRISEILIRIRNE